MKRLWLHLQSAFRVLRRSDQLNAEMQEEMRFHIESEAERLVREEGLAPEEAHRQACLRFGGVEKYKEEGRDARGFRWLDVLALDVRLGLRMLLKHRGLTLIGGFAIAVAIAIGAVFFEVITEATNPALPMEDGERIVSLQLATDIPGSPERRLLHDFTEWRKELRAVEQLGAFRNARHNLVFGNAAPEPVDVAEMTASGFDLAETLPPHGRYLLPADERSDAPPVAVIGHHAWQSRFGGDPKIVGKSIKLGGVSHAVVGVMPEGFKFPVDHQFWTPLRANPLEHERLQGPELFVFGRLAESVTLEQAQAEFSAVGQRVAAEHPLTHTRLRPVVLPYTRGHFNLDPVRLWMLRMAQILVGALAFVVAVNLAILVYARTVTRLGEIAVRTALGASRRRILAQLFIESLMLSVVGALSGLVLSAITLGRMESLILSNGSLPFWVNLGLSLETVAYALGLATLAALIMGVLPALKATGGQLNANLPELNGRTGTRLGPMWTALVVAQVAVAVAVLPAPVYLAWQMVQREVAGPGFAAAEFLVGVVALGDEGSAVDRNRVRERQRELASRLSAEPGVTGVTFSSSVPGFAGSREIQFEDGVVASNPESLETSTLDVGLEMFDTYGARLFAGRTFNAADLSAANAVVVNRTFASRFLEGRNPLDVRFRYTQPRTTRAGAHSQPWFHIVGVVHDFPSFSPAPGSTGEPTAYHPASAGDIETVVLSVRFAGGVPDGFVPRFREISAAVDPAMQARRVAPLSQYYEEVHSLWRYMAWGLGFVTASVLLLSAAGIYALMSFTVAQRTREIGIRAALGAQPRALLASIFGRALRQLTVGLLVGSVLSGAVFSSAGFEPGRATALLLSVAVLMLFVGLLVALGPARASLRLQTTEALKADS
jgi:putative ABC transport system permease protein